MGVYNILKPQNGATRVMILILGPYRDSKEGACNLRKQLYTAGRKTEARQVQDRNEVEGVAAELAGLEVDWQSFTEDLHSGKLITILK